ncbi:hypothetical protein EYF80_042187 [Liparis tanakae]|uniref:Uncharacterized protein n=1 Tax=Liparis tanakae TaxID=230148 RepID=A0A4Z2G242_9TELE|nr:hypothetical protein EYF80_042187 [Liparis tanakae]
MQTPPQSPPQIKAPVGRPAAPDGVKTSSSADANDTRGARAIARPFRHARDVRTPAVPAAVPPESANVFERTKN